MAGVRPVVVLKPAFAGLVAHRAIDWMMQQQELHGIPDGLMDPFGVRTNFHAFGDRRRARRHQLWNAFDFNEAHPAAAFDSNVRVVAVPGDLDAHFVRNLNDGLTFFRVVRLSVDRELGHNSLR